MRYLRITSPDIENGLGFRVTLWISGCKLHCPGCHNPESHDFMSGREITEETYEELFRRLEKPYIKGLTLSGGNPLDSDLEELIFLLKRIKMKYPKKDIYLFSGYTLDEILDSDKKRVLEYIDILIDGPFIIKQKDPSLAFRGSKNQVIWEKNSDGEFVRSKLN